MMPHQPLTAGGGASARARCSDQLYRRARARLWFTKELSMSTQGNAPAQEFNSPALYGENGFLEGYTAFRAPHR
jgi:hypothetical protein